MQVTELSVDGLKHEFKVVIPSAAIHAKVETRLAEVGRTIRLPGFRPGKVPLDLLRKKFGASVTGEVLEETVNDATSKTMDEHKIRPAMRPKVDVKAFDKDTDLEFTMAVEALPEFEVQDLASLSLERMVAEAPAATIEEALGELANRNGTDEPFPDDHEAAAGDIAVIDFLGKLDGTPFEGGKAENYRLTLGSNTFIPGFEDQLLGAKAGDERLVKVTFPEDYGAEKLSGKEAEFEVKVHSLLTRKPAEIDEELAKKVGFESLEELRTAFKSGIERDYATMSRAHLKRHLLDAMAKAYDFAVPESMTEAEFGGIWKDVLQQRKDGHGDPSDADKSEDELKAEYQSIAERRVRLGLVMAEIGRRNDITVSQEDLQKAVISEARRFPGQEQMVFQYYQKNPDAANSLRAPIFEEKIVDFILDKAQVTDRPVSVEELSRDPDAPSVEPATGDAPAAEPEEKA